jgi:hypothetical protein
MNGWRIRSCYNFCAPRCAQALLFHVPLSHSHSLITHTQAFAHTLSHTLSLLPSLSLLRYNASSSWVRCESGGKWEREGEREWRTFLREFAYTWSSEFILRPPFLTPSPLIFHSRSHTHSHALVHTFSLSRATHASQKPFIASTPYGIYPNKNTSERGRERGRKEIGGKKGKKMKLWVRKCWNQKEVEGGKRGRGERTPGRVPLVLECVRYFILHCCYYIGASERVCEREREWRERECFRHKKGSYTCWRSVT